MLATVVETRELVSTVLASLVAAVGVTAAFSMLILGAARFADLRRNDRPLLAAGAGTLMVLGLLATAAGIVIGIIVMTSKS